MTPRTRMYSPCDRDVLCYRTGISHFVYTCFREVYTSQNWLCQGGSFPVAFSLFRVQTSLSTVQKCTTAYIHVFEEMLQESYHPGKASFERYIPLWNMYIQNGWFLYDSIVHPYYKGCTDKFTAVYLKAVLYHTMIFHILGMNSDEPRTDRSIICIYHVQTRVFITEYNISVHTMFRHVYTKTYMHAHSC